MATLGDLKTFIASNMVRDDLAVDLADHFLAHINAAIRHYSGRNWWFLAKVATTPTVASQNYITRPTTVERIRMVSIPSLGYELDKVDITEIESLDEPTAQTGQPTAYAEYGSQLRLWPTPNAVFTVKIVGTEKLTALADDADENAWTNEGFDLIAARSEMTLCGFMRDASGVASAALSVRDAENALNEINTTRLDGPVCAAW